MTAEAERVTRRELGDDVDLPLPIPDGKGAEYVEAKIKELKKSKARGLTAIPANRRDLDTVMKIAMEKQRAFKEKQEELEKVERNINRLLVDVRTRVKKWRHFRKTISHITNLRFEQTLQRKGQTGEVGRCTNEEASKWSEPLLVDAQA